MTIGLFAFLQFILRLGSYQLTTWSTDLPVQFVSHASDAYHPVKPIKVLDWDILSSTSHPRDYRCTSFSI